MNNTSMAVSSPVHIIEQQGIDISLVNRYLAYLDVEPKTAETYTRQVRLFARYLSDNGIRNPDRQTMIDWKDYLVKSGHSAATIQTYLASVRLFFQWTEQEGIYPNICKRVRGPKVSHGHHRDYLTAEQICSVLGAIDRESPAGKRDYAMIYLTVTAGLRTIEISRATVGDIRKRGSKLVLYVQGKGRDEKVDYVQVIPEVEKALNEYLSTRENVADTAPLFCSTSHRNEGQGLSTRSISGIIKSRYKAVGLDSDRLTAHSLRHSAITLSVKAGESLQDVQQFARHLNISTTQIYYHESDMEKNCCSEKVGSKIAEMLGE